MSSTEIDVAAEIKKIKRHAEVATSGSPFMDSWHAQTVGYALYDFRQAATPELVLAIIAERDEARAQLADRDRVIAAVRELAEKWESDRDTCLAWIADESMHVDAEHPRRLSDKADMLNRSAERLRAALHTTAPTKGRVFPTALPPRIEFRNEEQG